jgi:hypothetical protein
MAHQPGTAAFLMQLTQQNSSLSEANAHLQRRVELLTQELELAQSAETALREHLKDALDRCDASEARCRALSDTATARVQSLRSELAATQEELEKCKHDLDDSFKAECAMRVLAVEAEGRAASVAGALETAQAKAAALAERYDTESGTLRTRLAAAERAVADARAAEQASHELALEAEHARARDATLAHALAAKSAQALAAAEAERSELYKRLFAATAAAQDADAAHRDADLQNAAASNLAAQLEHASAVIDAATERAREARSVSPVAVVAAPAPAPPQMSTAAVGVTAPMPLHLTQEQGAVSAVSSALVSAAVARVRAGAAEQELEDIAAELEELRATLEADEETAAASDAWAQHAAEELAAAQQRIEELEAELEAMKTSAADQAERDRRQEVEMERHEAEEEAPPHPVAAITGGEQGSRQRAQDKQPQCQCVVS